MLARLPRDLLEYTARFLPWIDLYALRQASVACNAAIPRSQADFGTVLCRRLAEVHDDPVRLCDQLAATGSYLTGSFVLQAMLGERWADGWDVNLIAEPADLEAREAIDEEQRYIAWPGPHRIANERNYRRELAMAEVQHARSLEHIHAEWLAGAISVSSSSALPSSFAEMVRRGNQRVHDQAQLAASMRRATQRYQHRVDVIELDRRISSAQYARNMSKQPYTWCGQVMRAPWQVTAIPGACHSVREWIARRHDVDFGKLLFDGRRLCVFDMEACRQRLSRGVLQANAYRIHDQGYDLDQGYGADDHIFNMHAQLAKYRARGFTVHSNLPATLSGLNSVASALFRAEHQDCWTDWTDLTDYTLVDTQTECSDLAQTLLRRHTWSEDKKTHRRVCYRRNRRAANKRAR
jgi:hypothetical protein